MPLSLVLQCPGLPQVLGGKPPGSETRGPPHMVTRGWTELTEGLAVGLQVPLGPPGLLGAAPLRAPSTPPGQFPGAPGTGSRLHILCGPELRAARLPGHVPPGGLPELAERCVSPPQPTPRQVSVAREARSARSRTGSPASSGKPSRC